MNEINVENETIGHEEEIIFHDEDGHESLETEEVQEEAFKIQRKFSLNFKKDQEDDAVLLNQKLYELGNSPIGDVDFEDVVIYLLKHKLNESDFDQIRAMAFDRKMNLACSRYNKENKTNYTLQEFLATAVSSYLH